MKRFAAVAALLVVLTLVPVAPAAAQDAPGAAADQARVEELLDQARKAGAKGQLPLTWWDVDERYKSAGKDGADAATWAGLAADAERLLNQALFVEEMRKRKSGMEALLGRFDQALREIGALYGVATDPLLSGTPAADDLLEKLTDAYLRRQVLVDSLTIDNRRLREAVGGRVAAQESLITALQVEVSSLRQRLWETELRAGVAEADRSAAESVLTSKQQRDEAIGQVRAMFPPAEADIMLTAGGALLLRIHGVAFAVGSAELQAGQEDLVDRIAAAARLFPGDPLRVEGHTDDTGSRAANLRLSRRRAETVAARLAERLGAGAVIETEGYGPDRPVALNSTAEGRALNRRIDVVIGAPD